MGCVALAWVGIRPFSIPGWPGMRLCAPPAHPALSLPDQATQILGTSISNIPLRDPHFETGHLIYQLPSGKKRLFSIYNHLPKNSGMSFLMGSLIIDQALKKKKAVVLKIMSFDGVMEELRTGH